MLKLCKRYLRFLSQQKLDIAPIRVHTISQFLDLKFIHSFFIFTDNNESNLPVVYVPKPVTSTSPTVTAEQHEISEIREEKHQHHGLDTSPTSSAASSESIASFNPYPLPTLSPKSLRQFLDEDLNEMMSGNKRKCSFDDDIDDDVFGNDTSLLNVCGMFQGQQQQPIQQYLSTQGFL